MKIRPDFKKTLHHYKGFTIHGDQYNTEGGWVLGQRYYIDGGIKRNYIIKKDGKPIFKFCIIETLKYAKQEIDEYIKRNHTL